MQVIHDAKPHVQRFFVAVVEWCPEYDISST
jgi:hypothetical protein